MIVDVLRQGMKIRSLKDLTVFSPDMDEVIVGVLKDMPGEITDIRVRGAVTLISVKFENEQTIIFGTTHDGFIPPYWENIEAL
jgi:hypothetical protein